MKLKLQTLQTVSILFVMLGLPACARADVVSDWNAIAVQSTIIGARPGQTE